jgi:hypothetical protein
VREANKAGRPFPPHVSYEEPGLGEFFYDAHTAAEAMGAGKRRRLAEEALGEYEFGNAFVLLGDRIQPQQSRPSDVAAMLVNLQDALQGLGFDVWREGTGLVVLGRLP